MNFKSEMNMLIIESVVFQGLIY